jgi:hypothetical protein
MVSNESIVFGTQDLSQAAYRFAIRPMDLP